VNEILGKEHVERPVERDPDLFLEARQLAQVDRAPQKPRHETRKGHAEDLRNARPSPDGRHKSQRRENKRPPRPAIDHAGQIPGERLALAHRMLRGGRIDFSRPLVLHGRAISQGPDARPIRYLHIFVDDEPAADALARERGNEGMGRGPGRPNERIAREPRAVTEPDAAVCHPGDLGVDEKLHLSTAKLALRVGAQFGAQLWQNHRTGMDEHDADLVRRQVRIVPDRLAQEVIDGRDCFHSGKTAAGDDSRQKGLPLADGALKIRLLEKIDQAVAQMNRVAQRFHRQCMFA